MRYVEADGERIAYEETGDGPALVFISGWGGTAAEWRGDMEYFAAYRRCITFEHPGVAGQPLPDGALTSADMAGRIALGLAALQIDSAAVIGLSMGGAVAQELALRRPDLVDRLVIAASFARMDARGARAIEICTRTMRECGLKAGLDMAYWLAFGEEFYEQNLEALDEALDQFLTDPLPAEVFEYQLDTCLEHDTRGRLPEISRPALIIHGDADILVRPRRGRELAENIPDARLSVFENGGHLCIWEQQQRFRREVAEFLA
jgi:pimeloyl-ACP methyl ester carboxylesterase